MTLTPAEARDAFAARLRAAYNPLVAETGWLGASGGDRERWQAVASAAQALASTDREQVASNLHAVFVRGLIEQQRYGWPPRSDAERDRWRAVADAYLQERATKAGSP